MVAKIQKKDNSRLTFECYAISAMSIGLTFKEVLELPIGLVYGLLNEKHNQMIQVTNKEEPEVIQGDANMLMNM